MSVSTSVATRARPSGSRTATRVDPGAARAGADPHVEVTRSISPSGGSKLPLQPVALETSVAGAG